VEKKKKKLTVIMGLSDDIFDYKKILRHFKKVD
jgi:translation initiation factor 1 (eIF-1/SUI1)